MTIVKKLESPLPGRFLGWAGSWRRPAAAGALVFAFSVLPATQAFSLDWKCPDAGLGDQACGRATCGDTDLTVGDALLALQASVGTASCSDCRCDTDSSGAVRASDASRILAASVGQAVAMTCPACNSLTIDAADQAADVGAVTDEIAATGDGGVVAAWSEGDSIFTLRFDALLAPVDPPAQIASSGLWIPSLRACARPDGSAAVAWESVLPQDFPTPHDYDDTGNVKAAQTVGAGETTGALGLHGDASGYQTPLGLLCLPSGEFTAIWRSTCTALRETSEGVFTSYQPTKCPLNGIYLRRFAADGTPLADTKLVLLISWLWNLPWERAIALPDGRFAVASANRLIVADADGSAAVETAMPWPSHLSAKHDCSAGADRCVAVSDAYSLNAIVHNVDSPDDAASVTVRALESSYEPPYDITIRGRTPTFACDSQGICLIAWTLVRYEEDWDHHYEDWTNIGIFARALNVHTGEVGPEIELTSRRIVNVGPGRFVSVEAGQGGTMLRALVVH